MEGRRETKKGGFPSSRLPVSNVQVPKFSLRSAGPLGIGKQHLPESRSPTHFPLPLPLLIPSLPLPPPLPLLFLFLVLLLLAQSIVPQLWLICMSMFSSAGHSPGIAPLFAA